MYHKKIEVKKQNDRLVCMYQTPSLLNDLFMQYDLFFPFFTMAALTMVSHRLPCICILYNHNHKCFCIRSCTLLHISI